MNEVSSVAIRSGKLILDGLPSAVEPAVEYKIQKIIGILMYKFYNTSFTTNAGVPRTLKLYVKSGWMKKSRRYRMMMTKIWMDL